jgi:hypothetical protein
MADTPNTLTVGSVSTGGSVYDPWPQTWTWPTTYTYVYPPLPTDEYANEVEVERREHDAVLHFYRSSGPGKGRTHIKTLTVPLGVLDWLTSDA